MEKDNGQLGDTPNPFDRDAWKKLLQMLEGERQSSEEAMHESMRREKQIPAKLYHITTREKLDSIMKDGLQPSKLIFSDDEVVSLSDDIDFALDVASETQKRDKEELVVLEIDTKAINMNYKNTANHLRYEDKSKSDPVVASAIHEVHYYDVIPPEAFNVVD